LTYTNSLTYGITLADNHNIEILALAEKYQSENSAFNAGARNDITNEIFIFGGDGINIGNELYETARMGYLGRINYNYAYKYIASVSIRRDASSRFGSNHRW